MKDDMSDLYRRVIAKWGEDAQLQMVVEECAELIVAVSKLRRKMKVDVRITQMDSREMIAEEIAVAEEIADVRIMLEQLELILNCEREVSIYTKEKLRRLEMRLR